MDFEITIGQNTRVFEQYYDALGFINECMAQWNNFQPHLILDIRIKKIPAAAPTLGVTVEEAIDAAEIFGRP